MEFKINFIFIVSIILALLLLLAFIIAIKDSIKSIKNKDKYSEEDKKLIKQFAFMIESYLSYDSKEESFCKDYFLDTVKIVAEEEFDVNFFDE